MTKTAEKSIPFGAAHTYGIYILYKRVTPKRQGAGGGGGVMQS